MSDCCQVFSTEAAVTSDHFGSSTSSKSHRAAGNHNDTLNFEENLCEECKSSCSASDNTNMSRTKSRVGKPARKYRHLRCALFLAGTLAGAEGMDINSGRIHMTGEQLIAQFKAIQDRQSRTDTGSSSSYGSPPRTPPDTPHG